MTPLDTGYRPRKPMAVPVRRPYDAKDKMLAACLVLGGMLAGAALLALGWVAL